MKNLDDTELERLLDCYFGGDISAADLEALQVILEKSETACQTYLSRVEMEAMLYQHFSGPVSFPKLDLGLFNLDSPSSFTN